MAKYAFYISGRSGRVMKYLAQIDDYHRKEICVVISDYIVDRKMRELLDGYCIPIHVIDDTLLEGTREEKNRQISDFICSKLEENEIDYMFSFGSHLLQGELLDHFRNRLINFHPAILPMFPGINALDRAAEQGNAFLIGNTAHFIDEGIDTGSILMQSVIPVKAFLEKKDYDLVLDLQIEMLKKLIYSIDCGLLEMENDIPIIRGADYNKHHFYPDINIE